MAVKPVTNNIVLQPPNGAADGQRGFLHLLTQLSRQDPFNPVDNQQMGS